MNSIRFGRFAPTMVAVAATTSLIACNDSASPRPQKTSAPAGALYAASASSVPGLVAAYSFDETSGSTANDASGNNNAGAFGSGVTRTTDGRARGGLVFSGSGMVSIPNTASLNPGSALTIEAWVKPTAVSSDWADIVYKGNDIYYLMASSDHNSRPAAGGRIGGGKQTEAFGTSALAANTWAHLAATYDGSSLKLYVNGTVAATTAKTGGLAASTHPLTIGGDAIFGQFFKGTIDEVRVYNRALDAKEIQVDMVTPVGAPPPPPDTEPPAITITTPSASGSYTTTDSVVTLGGTASDNTAVTRVTWSSDRGTSGSANGTSSWGVSNIPLPMGATVFTVSVSDAASNTSTATITVTRNAPTPPPAPAGLVAAYGFSEASGATSADVSGKGNTATIGSNVTRTSSGRYGGALQFNGGMVTVPHAAPLNLSSAMTLEAWVNPSTLSADWRDVVQKGNDNYYLMGTSDNSMLPAGGARFASDRLTAKAFGSSAIPANTWTHLAVTYDATTIRMYVNGNQVSSTAKSGAMMTSTNPLTIGGDPIYGQYFTGMIDEVRIYDRALSAAEVRTDMTTPVGGSATPPVDTSAPTVAIASPQASGTYTTKATQVSMSGSASDNMGVTQVRWSNNRGGSGVCSGTSSWSASAIALQAGTNVVTVTAQDAANNVSTAALTIVVDTTTTPPPPPTATKLSITTQPSSTTRSGVAFAQQPVIQLRDASSNAIAQSGVVVTASLASGSPSLSGTMTATTNASGVATFSNLSITGVDGARTIAFGAASLAGVTSSTVTVSTPVSSPPPSGGACSNQPAGYTVFNDQPWDNVPSSRTDLTMSVGWLDDSGDAANKLSIVNDMTSPFPSSNHNVVAGKFPQGSGGGKAPFNVYRVFNTGEQYKNLYMCMYVKHDANWDNTNGNAGTKFMWPAGDQVQGALTYLDHTSANMDFVVTQQGAEDRQLFANLNSAQARLYNRRGQWVRYEILMKANSDNSTADGGLDIWIDGVQTHHYTNVRWQMRSARQWLSLSWNPTYGGGLNPVPHDQWQYIDQLRLAGSNQ